MPRKCTVCHHPNRKSIERAFMAGHTYGHVGSRYDITSKEVRGHVTHMARRLMLARRSVEHARGQELADVAAEALVAAKQLLRDAKSGGDRKAWSDAIKALQRHVEVMGRLEGKIKEQPVLVILASPGWKMIEDAIFAALEPHTNARNAVARALLTVTNEGGSDG